MPQHQLIRSNLLRANKSHKLSLTQNVIYNEIIRRFNRWGMNSNTMSIKRIIEYLEELSSRNLKPASLKIYKQALVQGAKRTFSHDELSELIAYKLPKPNSKLYPEQLLTSNVIRENAGVTSIIFQVSIFDTSIRHNIETHPDVISRRASLCCLFLLLVGGLLQAL